MAITLDKASLGTATSNVGATTLTLTTTGAVAAGATILVGLGSDGPGQPGTVTSSAGVTWTFDRAGQNATSTDWAGVAHGYAAAGLASGSTITGTWSAAVSSRMICASSFTAASALTVVTSGTQTAGVAAWNSGTLTTTSPAVIFAASEIDSATTSTPTSPAVEATDFKESGSGNALTTVYNLQAAAGSFNTQGTWAVATNGVVVAVAFRENPIPTRVPVLMAPYVPA